MMNKQITLYIGGTKQRQAGFADLAIIGVFPVGEFKNMDRVTLIAEKPVWCIKHTSDYILYHLIDRRVKSFDADAPGVLSIAMTIPNDMQLADGKSPYTLLKSVYDKFRNEYMTPYSDGRDSFLDMKVEKDDFQEIVDQYSLEQRKGRYVVMNGTLTGTFCVAQNKMEELFRDSQYAEFANYKDIEIGSSCATTMGLELLEIPRPVSYEVWVNGSRQVESLSKPSDCYSTRLSRTEEFYYKNISFTLGDLLASENGIFSQGASSVKLDKVNRRIDCDVQKVEIKYKGLLKFIGKPGNKDVVKRAVENGDIRIDLGSCNLMDYQTSDLEFEIPSRLLRNPNLSITPNKTKQGMILSVMYSTQQEQQTITIEVTIREEEKKVVTPPVPVTRHGNKNGNKSSDFKKQSDKQEFQEEDPVLVEERKRKEAEKRKKLLVIGFVVGFVSALLLSGLGFGAYWMLKEDVSKQSLDFGNKLDSLSQKLSYANNVINRLRKDSTAQVKIIEKWELEYKELEKQGQGRDKGVIKSENKAKAEQAKAEILELVKSKQLNDCRSHEGWKKYLTNNERLAVEAILNTDQFKDEKDKNTKEKKYTPATIKKVKDYVKELRIDSWDDIIAARGDILNILNNKN